MSNDRPIHVHDRLPRAYEAMAQTQAAIDGEGLDRTLHHLVVLRASQINQCAFCVKMHTREAREDGESSERLDRLIVWRHCNDFSRQEKAALAWTEALTQLQPATDYAPLRAQLREYFSDDQIAVLTATVAMINLWNRIQVATH